MVENKKTIITVFISLWVLIVAYGLWVDQHKPISSKEAVRIVRALPVVQSFFNAADAYDLSECVVEKVMRPCDTQWVTCIEEAWVVEFSIDTQCILHDGRLAVTVVVDALDRRVVSRFPEQDYFVKPEYCLEDYDCLCDKEKSLNFIFGQLQNFDLERACECRKNRCEP